MPTITFNAFSFLQKKLKARNLAYANATLELADGTTPKALMSQMKLTQDEVEVIFINGKVGKKDTPLMDNDRVAFVPQGTPGPYRVLLGFKNKKEA